MLRKRLIFTLIYCQQYFMQSRNFRLQKIGNLQWLEKNFQLQKIAFSLDELIILNAAKDEKDILTFAKIISCVSENIFIPIAAGGGIRSLKDAEYLFLNGADKLVINSAIYHHPSLIQELVNKYGSQSIIASIDYKKCNGQHIVYIADGTSKVNMPLIDYILHSQSLGVGEVYLNSIDQDGTGFGYDIETIHHIKNNINIPLIIAGGAGNAQHLLEGLKIKEVNGVATANLFNFIADSLPNARKEILNAGINIANWH